MTAAVKLKKCLDVVYMKEKIGTDSVLDFLASERETGNDSYIAYIVGQYSGEEEYNEEDYDGYDNMWKYRRLDEILVKNYGLHIDEEVLLLIWW